jgi:hypothetical protein
VSFLSYEDGVSLGIVAVNNNARAWYPMKVSVGPGGAARMVDWTRQDLRCEAHSLDGLVELKFQPRIVRNWRSSALARRCPVGRCPESELEHGVGFWCGNRRALIGRDILRLNQIRVVLDSVEGRTYVLDKEVVLGTGLENLEGPGVWEWTDEDEDERDE